MIKSKGKKLDLSLSITLTLFLASTPFILIFFYLGKVWVSVFLAVVDLAFIFFYFLGRKGYVWAPTVGTILLANLSTYFFNIVLGSNTQIYILFFPFVILPLIVVDIRKRVTRAVLTGIPILGYFLTHFIKFNPFFSDRLFDNRSQIVHFGVLIATFSILIIVEKFLFKENEASENALIESNIALKNSNVQLAQQASQLEQEKSEKENLLKDQIQTSIRLEAEVNFRKELYGELECKILESEQRKKIAEESAKKEHHLRMDFEAQSIELAKKLKLEQDLIRARKMQERILPKTLPDTDAIFLDAVFEPARHLSGDYWTWRYLGPNKRKIVVVLADVMGKAAEAGIASLSFAQKVNDFFVANDGRDLEIKSVFNFIRKVAMSDVMMARKSLSIAVILVDLDTQIFEYGNAGLERMYYMTNNNGQWDTHYLEPENGPFGMEENEIVIQKRSYEPGSVLISFTDGAYDIQNQNKDRLNEDGFDLLKQNAIKEDMHEILPTLLKGLYNFQGKAEPADDITMVLLGFR